MTQRIAFILTVVAVLSLLALAQGTPPADGPKILVVYLKKAVESSNEWRDVVADLKAKQTAKQKEFDEQVRELKKTAEALKKKRLDERDEQFLQALFDAELKLGRLQAEKLRVAVQLSDRLARKLSGLLQDAQQAADDIMHQRGAAIVLVSRTGPIKLETEQDLTQEYVSRRVLAWADPKADITGDVAKQMNEWYKKRGPVPGREDKEGKEAPAEKPPR